MFLLSLLKIYWAAKGFSASIRKSVSKTLGTRQDSTQRECRSTMTTRSMNPLAIETG